MTEIGFGGLLRRYRLAAGLTQEELAERSGLSARGDPPPLKWGRTNRFLHPPSA